jgi:hypothetical protein
MTVVSRRLLRLASPGLSGCHGIGVVHNNKTTSAIVSHFVRFRRCSVFRFPKKKCSQSSPCRENPTSKIGGFVLGYYVLNACNFAIPTQSPGTAISLEVCSFIPLDVMNYINIIGHGLHLVPTSS